jgi:pyrroline-5-carboxylate reductase
MLRCRDGSLYTGSAKNVAARLLKHQQGSASRYTRSRLPVKLVWWRKLANWGTALREEYRIKQLRRADKQALITSRRRGVRRRAPAR